MQFNVLNKQERPQSILTVAGLLTQAQLTLWSHQQNALPSLWVFSSHCARALSSAFYPFPSSLFFSLTCHCDGCLVPFAWGLMAGWFRSPAMGAQLCLGAGCQKWKPQDIPTQPASILSDAGVNFTG